MNVAFYLVSLKGLEIGRGDVWEKKGDENWWDGTRQSERMVREGGHRMLSSHCCGTECSVLIAKLFAFLGCNTSPHPSTKPGKYYAQASFWVKEVIFVDIKKMDHIPHLCPSEAKDKLHVEKSKIIYKLS